MLARMPNTYVSLESVSVILGEMNLNRLSGVHESNGIVCLVAVESHVGKVHSGAVMNRKFRMSVA